MWPPPEPRHILRRVLSILLLAVLCIGGMELAFCSVAEPVLFHGLVDPVVDPIVDFTHRTGAAVSQTAGHLAESARTGAAALKENVENMQARAVTIQENLVALAEVPEEPESQEAQVASEPAIRKKIVYADPTVTEFLAEPDGGELLTGGLMPLVYYNQADEAWAEQRYGRDPIGKYGCGPTALSMLVSTLTEESLDPAEMSAWAAKTGHWASKSGSYLSIVEDAAEAFGLDCRSLPVDDPEELVSVLSTGGCAVALMGPGHFTKHGHFILLHGVTLDGSILVADPNSRDNSLVTWDPQLILDELSPSRHNGAPLWLLTPAFELLET